MSSDPLGPSGQEPAWPSSPNRPDTSSYLGPSASQQQQQRIASGHGSRPPPLESRDRAQPGDYGKETQVYGQPQSSLMSPSALSPDYRPGGASLDRLEPFLPIRISSMERNRKDLLLRFDATTNLPNFRTTLYKNMQRSYVEFRLLAEQLTVGNPQTIVAALPLPQSSAATDEEDDRLVRIAIQRWFQRICMDLVLLQDEELRSFIESDFGYNPIPRPRRKAPSTFPIALPLRKGPHDDDEELASARLEVAKLDGLFADAAKAIDKLSKARKSMAAAEVDLSTKLVTTATTEQAPNLSGAMRKLGRATDAIAGMHHSQAVSENVVLGDTLGYQSLNARVAKDTLVSRTAILEDYHAAAKLTIAKRRVVERMKGSSSITSTKVDDAISEMDEASTVEQVLATRLSTISSNLHVSLRTHSRHAHEDVAIALLEHARLSGMYERSVLKELEALRSDFSRIAGGVVPGSAGANAKGKGRQEDGERYDPLATGSISTGTGSGKVAPPSLASSNSFNTAQRVPPTRAWVHQPTARGGPPPPPPSAPVMRPRPPFPESISYTRRSRQSSISSINSMDGGTNTPRSPRPSSPTQAPSFRAQQQQQAQAAAPTPPPALAGYTFGGQGQQQPQTSYYRQQQQQSDPSRSTAGPSNAVASSSSASSSSADPLASSSTGLPSAPSSRGPSSSNWGSASAGPSSFGPSSGAFGPLGDGRGGMAQSMFQAGGSQQQQQALQPQKPAAPAPPQRRRIDPKLAASMFNSR